MVRFSADKNLFELLVKRELDCHMCKSQERGPETGVERAEAFVEVHLSGGVDGGFIVPWWAGAGVRGIVVVAVRGLRHEAGFDDPDGVCAYGAGAAGNHCGEDVCKPLLFGLFVTQPPFAPLIHRKIHGPSR